jgi:hypothetical protein
MNRATTIPEPWKLPDWVVLLLFPISAVVVMVSYGWRNVRFYFTKKRHVDVDTE